MYQGIRLNLGKSREIIIFMSLLTPFNDLWAARLSPKIGSSLKPNHRTVAKLILSKSLIHTVDCVCVCLCVCVVDRLLEQTFFDRIVTGRRPQTNIFRFLLTLLRVFIPYIRFAHIFPTSNFFIFISLTLFEYVAHKIETMKIR